MRLIRFVKWFREHHSYQIMIASDSAGSVKRWFVTARNIRYAMGVTLVLGVVLGLFATGFFHYHSEYVAVGDVRIENARFDEEKAFLVNKITALESALGRVERFTNRVEALVDLPPEEMLKGIGPFNGDEASESKANLTFSAKRAESLLFTSPLDLDLKLDELGETVVAIEERLQNVFEAQQDQRSFDAAIPSRWPIRGWVTSRFGPRRRPTAKSTRFHEGLDIGAPYGSPAVSPGDGIVTYAGRRGGYGNAIVIDHGYGIVTTYGHAAKLLVQEGQRVRRGEPILLVGNTGQSTGTHLHFEIIVDGLPVNPEFYLPERG